MKQGDFHSTRFSPHRDFVGLDSDFSLSIPPSGFQNKLLCSIFGRTQKAFASPVTKTKMRRHKPHFSTQRASVFADAGAHSLLGGYVRSIFVRDLAFTLLLIRRRNRKDVVGLFPVLAFRKHINIP
jgi:hypothetical protein